MTCIRSNWSDGVPVHEIMVSCNLRLSCVNSSVIGGRNASNFWSCDCIPVHTSRLEASYKWLNVVTDSEVASSSSSQLVFPLAFLVLTAIFCKGPTATARSRKCKQEEIRCQMSNVTYSGTCKSYLTSHLKGRKRFWLGPFHNQTRFD